MNRLGTSLLEMIIALTLTLIILTGVGVILGRVEQTFRRQALRLEQIEVLRIARDRVSRSVHTGGARSDAPASDGLSLRAFRGSAAWCGDGWVETGVRAPDPARDSVWWISPFGEERVLALKDREAGGCAGAGYRWTGQTEGASGDGDGADVSIAWGVVRYFESGRLRVDDAVRYGRLGLPAQPLTPAVLTSGSRLQRLENGVIEFQAWFGDGPPVVRRWPGG